MTFVLGCVRVCYGLFGELFLLLEAFDVQAQLVQSLLEGLMLCQQLLMVKMLKLLLKVVALLAEFLVVVFHLFELCLGFGKVDVQLGKPLS